MMDRKTNWGLLLILTLMSGTIFLLLREQPLSSLLGILSTIRPGYVLLGLGLMFCFVGCEAMCSKLILAVWGTTSPTAGAWVTPLPGSMSAPSPPPLREGSPPRSITCPKTAYPRPTAPSI